MLFQNVLGYTAASEYRTWLAISDRKEEGAFVYESDGDSLEYENWQNGYGIHRGDLDTRHECGFMINSATHTWYTTYCNTASTLYRYICEASE